MTQPKKIARCDSSIKASDVRKYLSENSDFLTRNPELYSVLIPPLPRTNDRIVDMQLYINEQLRKEINTLRSERQNLIDSSRSNLTSQGCIHAAVISLLDAPTFDQFIEVMNTDLTNFLHLDVVTLYIEGNFPMINFNDFDAVFPLPHGHADKLIGEGIKVLLKEDEGANDLFGSACKLVRSYALIRLESSGTSPDAILALGSRLKRRFHPRQGTELLSFLGDVVAKCIRAWLDLPPK